MTSHLRCAGPFRAAVLPLLRVVRQVWRTWPLVDWKLDETADVSAFTHVIDSLIDLLQAVTAGDQFVEFERTGLIHRQQHRHAGARVHPTVESALELLSRI